MSREQQKTPQAGEPIKYGHVFPVDGELAGLPIAPRDAALMQSAENLVLGQTRKDGAASAMQSAAALNEKAGLVGHSELNEVAGEVGMSVAQTSLLGTGTVVTEAVAGQVVGEYVQPVPTPPALTAGLGLTIGEALEAAALTAGDKPINQSDAAAIQAAEVRATGINQTLPGGVAAAAQSAADTNLKVTREEDKTKLGEVVGDATSKLPSDKVVTREDAGEVLLAEARNNPKMRAHAVGVGASMTAAAWLNHKAV